MKKKNVKSYCPHEINNFNTVDFCSLGWKRISHFTVARNSSPFKFLGKGVIKWICLLLGLDVAHSTSTCGAATDSDPCVSFT